MGKVTGFKEYARELPGHAPIEERVKHFREFDQKLPDEKIRTQAARCMDCGLPFCHKGCPLGNIIPDFNDLVYRGRWREALERLQKTNNFPEFTGRVCPAPCEYACVLGINSDPITIKMMEKSIIDRAFEEGWVAPKPPAIRTGKRVAVVGSGPAGLAAAQQLNRAGHFVTVYEQADRLGGLLRYGIPDFKLEKHLVQRRVDQMTDEGVVFKTKVRVGVDLPATELLSQFDVLLLAGGAMKGRELPVPGRQLKGVHLAIEFLAQQNKVNAGDVIPSEERILATGKHVVVIGGGDTGSDCIGTAHRQGALSVHQFEILPKPPLARTELMPWPHWPAILRTSSSQEEGAIRQWCISTTEFLGENGEVKRLRGRSVQFGEPDETGRRPLVDVPGSEFEISAELVLLAMGFAHPEHEGMIKELSVTLDPRGNVKTGDGYMTSRPGVFAAGDMRRGASLVVWALAEGRAAAREIDRYLMTV